MQHVESRKDEIRGGAFAWILPFVLAVIILALSWTGLYVVIHDLVNAASSASATAEPIRE